MTALDVGIDLGSTWLKALAFDSSCRQVAAARAATPWRSLPDGGAEMSAEDLVALVHRLLDDLAAQLAELPGRAAVRSIGFSGMAEAGVLLDGAGDAVLPLPAWFDPRGEAEFSARPAELLDVFPEVTGLPVSALATVAKLHHHRARGLDLRGLTWLDVPEYVAHVLGGERWGEASLQARTGLLDQDTGKPWHAIHDDLGVDVDLLAPTADAGQEWGRARGVPAGMRGAVLTVAGHDHLVAALAAGVVDEHQLYDSMGTAEALVRILGRPLPASTRGRLARSGVNVVQHLLPDRWTLLAGTRGGLVLRRVLALVGVHGDEARDALDAAVIALPDTGSGVDTGVTVAGADNTSSRLRVEVEVDDVTPARLFAAALDHGTEVLRAVVATIDAEIGPATETVAAGGWIRMESVRRARRDVLPGVTFSERAEDAAFGAALVGGFAADPDEHDLAAYVTRRLDDEPGPARPPEENA